jgi:hypothetical protein
VVLLGLVLWLLLAFNTVLGPQAKLLPSPLNTAHVRTTVMVALAGPLLAVFCSPGAATVALEVKGPAAVGRTTMGSWLLPPTGMEAMLQVTVVVVVPATVQPAKSSSFETCHALSGSQESNVSNAAEVQPARAHV